MSGRTPTEHLQRLKQSLAAAPQNRLYQRIVDAPFDDKLFTTSLDLGIVVLLLLNEKDQMIDRIALSKTELASGAVKVSAKPFSQIRIPADYEGNAIAKAVETGEYRLVEDWQFLFAPALKPEEARRNQAGASIECSLVQPLLGKRKGALIFSFFQPAEYIDAEHLTFTKQYAQLVSERLARS